MNVWCGLTYDGERGTFIFLEPAAPRPRTLVWLNCMRFPNYRLELSANKTAHHLAIATSWGINHTMPRSRIGRGAPISWPPRSPAFTTLNYFPVGLYEKLRLTCRKRRSPVVARPCNRCLRTYEQRPNIIWIFVVPLGVPTLKSIKVGRNRGGGGLREFSVVMVPTGLARDMWSPKVGYWYGASSNRYSLNFFDLERGWRNILRASAQIADNFRRNSRALGDFEK
jgi:hypothetical protein